MNHIDRLLLKAKELVKPGIRNAFCIVERDVTTGKWATAPLLCDGVSGSGFTDAPVPTGWKSEYNTKEEAAEAVDSLFSALNIDEPNRLVILVDDMGVSPCQGEKP